MSREMKEIINLGNLFTIEYGYIGGATVSIARHILLKRLKGELTKKEITDLLDKERE